MGTQYSKELGKRLCAQLLQDNTKRVSHFKQRVSQRGLDPQQLVIVLLEVDDHNGGLLADILMPNQNWQAYRGKGQLPIARGLALRDFMQEALDTIDQAAASKLRAMKQLVVVVVGFGTADVFST